MGENMRHVIDRLEAWMEEATELRIRLELTGKAEFTVREDLAEERCRREEVERGRPALEAELEALREAQESPTRTGPSGNLTGAEGGAQEPEQNAQAQATTVPQSDTMGPSLPLSVVSAAPFGACGNASSVGELASVRLK